MAAVLVADDNRQIASVLEEYLKKENHTPVLASDGEQALELFHSRPFDAVLLDVMMPKVDGFSVCREIRKTSTVPVIMITARGEDFERIMGLDIGADDYIVKPFSPGEVMARLRAVLRRMQPREGKGKQTVTLGNLWVSADDYLAKVGDAHLTLTKKEFEILWTLAEHPGKVFSAAITCWKACGATIILAIPAPWIPTSSASGPRWRPRTQLALRLKPSGV